MATPSHLRRTVPRAVAVFCIAAFVGACSDGAAAPEDLGFAGECSLFSPNIAIGQNRDAIPALTLPQTESGDVDFMQPDDRVLGVVVNGEARAYPFFILWWHEVVNDIVGNEPIAVTYCPLTGSGLTFSSRVDGVALEFGVSGLVFENNLMMFDRATESLWPQMLSQSRCGVASGSRLTPIPTVETTWSEWRRRHPSTTVVTPNTGFGRNYGSYPYGNYDFPSVGQLLFPSSPYSAARQPKERVLGLAIGDDAAAYPYWELALLGESVALNETVGGAPILLTFDSPSVTALAFDRVVDGQTLTFAVSEEDPAILVDTETGSSWDLYGEALAGPLSGQRLTMRAEAYVAFWFAWSVFHPDTRLPIG